MADFESIAIEIKKRVSPADYRDGYLAGLRRLKQLIDDEIELDELLYKSLSPDKPPDPGATG